MIDRPMCDAILIPGRDHIMHRCANRAQRGARHVWLWGQKPTRIVLCGIHHLTLTRRGELDIAHDGEVKHVTMWKTAPDGDVVDVTIRDEDVMTDRLVTITFTTSVGASSVESAIDQALADLDTALATIDTSDDTWMDTAGMTVDVEEIAQ